MDETVMEFDKVVSAWLPFEITEKGTTLTWPWTNCFFSGHF